MMIWAFITSSFIVQISTVVHPKISVSESKYAHTRTAYSLTYREKKVHFPRNGETLPLWIELWKYLGACTKSLSLILIGLEHGVIAISPGIRTENGKRLNGQWWFFNWGEKSTVCSSNFPIQSNSNRFYATALTVFDFIRMYALISISKQLF